MGRSNRVWDMVSIKPPSGSVINIPIRVREVGSGGAAATSRIEEAKESGGRDLLVPDVSALSKTTERVLTNWKNIRYAGKKKVSSLKQLQRQRQSSASHNVEVEAVNSERTPIVE